MNNCAAALVLILRHFAAKPPRTQVIISRGELIQIGGGFRIPEILEASGCVLREVGTTNKTTLDDYRRAIDDQAALILRVHPSNFYMGGFVESPTAAELATVVRETSIPFVFDIGSGATFDTESLGGGEREPTALDAIRDGADLITFSGDKLLGGPQAGIIAGRRELVAALKNAPFFRALRCDKLILAALQTTVDLLLDGGAEHVQIRRMMQIPLEILQSRAEKIVAGLRDLPIAARIGRGDSRVGGGSLPRTALPSVTIECTPTKPGVEQLQTALRLGSPPVIGYIADGRFRLDLRTIFPDQDADVATALRGVVATF